MTKPPFGFSGPQSGDDDPERDDQSPPPSNPFAFGFSGMQLPGMPGGQLPSDLSGLMPMIQQLQQVLMGGSGSGPVNWDLARQTALTAARQQEKPTGTTTADVEQALRIADLWLDDTTSFPSGVRSSTVWTRSEWVGQTLGVWSQLCDPIAAKMVTAMTSLMPEGGLGALPGMPEGMGQLPGLDKMLEGMGGMMFGSQVGQALAQLSSEVLTSTDIGLPLGPDGVAVLVGQNVDELAASLDHDIEEVRLYLALREAAYHRLFAHVPWLRKKLLGTIETYASGITIDRQAIENALGDVSPEDFQANPQKIQEIMSSGVFEPQRTEAQKQQLDALETLLALVEGWVDRVVSVAVEGRLPGASGLREMMRRRRATGGPAEQTFATLVGLVLRPRRLRDAAEMWERIEARDGVEGRDHLWEHPDLLPTSEDFTAPSETQDDEPRLTEADFEALLASDGAGGPVESLDGGIAPEEDDDSDGPDDERPGGPQPAGA